MDLIQFSCWFRWDIRVGFSDRHSAPSSPPSSTFLLAIVGSHWWWQTESHRGVFCWRFLWIFIQSPPPVWPFFSILSFLTRVLVLLLISGDWWANDRQTERRPLFNEIRSKWGRSNFVCSWKKRAHSAQPTQSFLRAIHLSLYRTQIKWTIYYSSELILSLFNVYNYQLNIWSFWWNKNRPPAGGTIKGH